MKTKQKQSLKHMFSKKLNRKIMIKVIILLSCLTITEYDDASPNVEKEADVEMRSDKRPKNQCRKRTRVTRANLLTG